MMDSFALLAYASLVASRTLLQRLLACLNFTLESEDFSLWYKQKSDFYELWQQHKQLKTMEMSEAWPDTYDERDICISSNLNPLTKFNSSSRDTEFNYILPWNITQMITKTISISARIVISYAMKRGIPLRIWKVNGNWDNNMTRITQWRERHCGTNTSIRRKKEIQKIRTVRVTGWDPSRKVNHLSKVVRDIKIKTDLTGSII